VNAFIRAINERDYRRAWLLGGDDLSAVNGQTYRQFAAGFARTARDVIIAERVSGQVVRLRILAYETTGPVQTYALTYVVSGGLIVAGSEVLLGTAG